MKDNPLDHDQQEFLLKLARDSIIRHLDTGKSLTIAKPAGALNEKRGAFVTLKTDNKLRGCIGYPIPHQALYLTVIEAAEMAAFRDYRFDPLKKAELLNTKIEISVLSLPRAVTDIQEIEVGKHGIIISQGVQRGLLLPQVPVEWGWDLVTYLRHGCMKAGLDENAWEKKPVVKIEIFTAQVFSEDDL